MPRPFYFKVCEKGWVRIRLRFGALLLVAFIMQRMVVGSGDSIVRFLGVEGLGVGIKVLFVLILSQFCHWWQ